MLSPLVESPILVLSLLSEHTTIVRSPLALSPFAERTPLELPPPHGVTIPSARSFPLYRPISTTASSTSRSAHHRSVALSFGLLHNIVTTLAEATQPHLFGVLTLSAMGPYPAPCWRSRPRRFGVFPRSSLENTIAPLGNTPSLRTGVPHCSLLEFQTAPLESTHSIFFGAFHRSS